MSQSRNAQAHVHSAPPPENGAHGAAHANPEARNDADLGFDLPPPARLSPGRVAVYLLLGVGALSAAFVFGWLPKRQARHDVEAGTEAKLDSVPRVIAAVPKVLSSDRSMVLPGSVSPLEEAEIRSRANGYVSRRIVDIGDKVDAGALLLEVDTPELDQQLEQARAQLAQANAALVHARADSEYAKTSLARREKLAPSGVTSEEELDKARSEAKVADASIAVAQANLDAQAANVRRLTNEKSFARVTAPFPGTIVSRTTEKGSLVSPTAELYRIATTDPMRVLVEVPQDVATGVKNGISAKVTVREFAGRTFDGTVARFASALDSRSRTMTTVVHVPNPKGELLSGMYAQVELSLPMPHRVLEVPATALIADSRGTRVAVVDADHRIHLVPIVIERDTGPTLQIATGIADTDKVVAIPSAELTEGRQVEITDSSPENSGFGRAPGGERQDRQEVRIKPCARLGKPCARFLELRAPFREVTSGSLTVVLRSGSLAAGCSALARRARRIADDVLGLVLRYRAIAEGTSSTVLRA